MRYKYRKIAPSIVEEMKELRKQGWFYKDIAKKFNISVNTVKYHLILEVRKACINRAKRYNTNLTKKQKKEKTKKQKPYMKKYMNERYKNDEEFKKSFIKMVQKNFNQRRKKWEKQNKCSMCGREKINKKFVTCERCREVIRKKGKYNRERAKKRKS